LHFSFGLFFAFFQLLLLLLKFENGDEVLIEGAEAEVGGPLDAVRASGL